MKIKKRIIIIPIIAFLLIGITLFLLSHQTYYKYNDWWVIGKSMAEIEERYGEFDIELGSRKGYFIYTDNSWVMPDHLDHYYYIKFDENGIATEVSDGVQPGG